jgi:putative transposase
MLAAGVFHADCAVTLRRLYCLFVLEAGSRYVPIPGVTAHPDGPWTTRQIRDLLIDLGHRPRTSGSWSATAPGRAPNPPGAVRAGAGIEAVKIPPRSPRANADAERLVRTART